MQSVYSEFKQYFAGIDYSRFRYENISPELLTFPRYIAVREETSSDAAPVSITINDWERNLINAIGLNNPHILVTSLKTLLFYLFGIDRSIRWLNTEDDTGAVLTALSLGYNYTGLISVSSADFTRGRDREIPQKIPWGVPLMKNQSIKFFPMGEPLKTIQYNVMTILYRIESNQLSVLEKHYSVNLAENGLMISIHHNRAQIDTFSFIEFLGTIAIPQVKGNKKNLIFIWRKMPRKR